MRRTICRAFREAGCLRSSSAMEESWKLASNEVISRHRPIMNIGSQRPVLAADVFVAPNAAVIGDVLCYDRSAVWYGAVVRGDMNKIRIGRMTNILDRAVLNTVSALAVDTGFPSDMNIGSYVTIGQGSILTSCTIGDYTQIEPGVVVCEGAVVEKNCIIAAGAVIAPGALIPEGQLWAGNPAKYIRDVAEEEIGGFEKAAEATSNLAQEHADEFLPYGSAYLEAEKKGL